MVQVDRLCFQFILSLLISMGTETRQIEKFDSVIQLSHSHVAAIVGMHKDHSRSSVWEGLNQFGQNFAENRILHLRGGGASFDEIGEHRFLFSISPS
jgi:hypothetical protein